MASPDRSRSTRLNISLTPAQLQEWLDRWALRREKRLTEQDLPAARQARTRAGRCRQLEGRRATTADAAWGSEWHDLRLEIAAFLQKNGASAEDA